MSSHALFETEGVVDDLFYGGVRGNPECVLWAAILELQCAKCKKQDRWRGRTAMAVASVARLAGWIFNRELALCPDHSSVKPRVYRKQGGRRP